MSLPLYNEIRESETTLSGLRAERDNAARLGEPPSRDLLKKISDEESVLKQTREAQKRQIEMANEQTRAIEIERGKAKIDEIQRNYEPKLRDAGAKLDAAIGAMVRNATDVADTFQAMRSEIIDACQAIDKTDSPSMSVVANTDWNFHNLLRLRILATNLLPGDYVQSEYASILFEEVGPQILGRLIGNARRVTPREQPRQMPV